MARECPIIGLKGAKCAVFTQKGLGFELFPPLLRINVRTSPPVQPQMPPELQDVMGKADEIPLSFDCGQTSQKETPYASVFLDLTENRLTLSFRLE